jgi:hypothetical protein
MLLNLSDIIFDPGVFVDDDGRVYGYWGFCESNGAELDSTTMATLKPGTEIVKDILSNPVGSAHDLTESPSSLSPGKPHGFRQRRGSVVQHGQNVAVTVCSGINHRLKTFFLCRTGYSRQP